MGPSMREDVSGKRGIIISAGRGETTNSNYINAKSYQTREGKRAAVIRNSLTLNCSPSEKRARKRTIGAT